MSSLGMGLLTALATLSPPAGQVSRAQATNPYSFRLYDPDADPVVCRPLGADEEIPLQLIDAMRRALDERNGLGIAAPHVGGYVRVALVPVDGERTIMLNPRIVGHSKTANRAQEGSLTTPGFFCSITRWDRVTVRYEDEHRKARQAKLEGLEARVLQNQVDALDGRLLPPGMTRQQRRHAARAAADAAARLEAARRPSAAGAGR